MSAQWIGRAFLLLVGLACVVPAEAEDFFQGIARDVKRRNCWPEPFTGPDRQATREPFAIIVANGWQQQNLVSGYHFQGEGQLNEAGRLKVQWVLNEAPEQHRVIFVRRGANPQETAARIAAVQQCLAQSSYPGDPPVPILESRRSDDGWPADRVDAVGRKFQAATPDPKLPATTQSSGGSTNK
jgi:hypothetical protein